jgi:hypothetical protein
MTCIQGNFRFIALCALLLLGSSARAQLQFSLGHSYNHELSRHLEKRDVRFHSAIKPYRDHEVSRVIQVDSIYDVRIRKGCIGRLSAGDIAAYRGEKFSISVNPLFDLVTAYDAQAATSVLEAGFGGRLEATFWNRIGLGFTYRAYRGDPVEYVRNRSALRQFHPGYREAKGLDGSQIRSQEFEGYLSVVANDHFMLEGGFGEHFWGDGYRSFFLSDNASSYPYFKFSLNFWRIKYEYLFSVLKYGSYDLETNTFDISDPQTKFGVFHYLSIDAAKWFEFGFFEGVVWKKADSTGVRGVEWNYLNPVVFIRPVEFALGSPDNVILGFNFKFKLGDATQLYTQLILDDLDIGKAREGSGFYRTKVAWQTGLRSFDLFGVEHLDIHSEFNLARPYVFAHKTTEQNYAHYTQSLAHPLGANFWEWLIFLKYRKGRWMAALDFQWARIGGDDLTNPNNNHNGSNIFVSDFEIVDNIQENLDFAYGNEFLQGVLNDITSVKISGGYLLNPHLNMRLSVFVQHRVLNIPDMDLTEKNTLMGIRFTTALFNRYDDF